MSQRDPFSRSPPRTPPSQTATYRPKRGYPARPSVRDAFPDVSVDAASRPSESDDGRDPHDLNLSPKHAARTSVVDNMLLSLDQFATTPTAPVFDDYQLYKSAMDGDMAGRFRGHTFSSSFSSEADYHYDDAAHHATATVTKGRRSNSSSNYQSLPRRMDSTQSREAIASRSGTMPRANDSRDNSKGSTSTLDYTFPIPRMRADSDGLDRHSASFDCGPNKYNPYSEASFARDSLLYDDDDAAPTPSIPAGPRRFPEYRTPTGPGARTPVVSRRNSVKSSQPSQSRKNRPENLGTGVVKSRDGDFESFNDAALDLPPTMGTLNHPAPSPTISYNKPAFPQPEPTAVSTTTTISTANNIAPNKERPGFFRRVFGGASKASSPGPAPALTDSPTSNVSDLSYLQENEVKDSTGAAANLKGAKLQPPKSSTGPKTAPVPPPTPTRQGPPQQVVNKKSSFFRRRKKSVAEHAPPPIVLPQHLAGPLTLDSMKPEPSPVGSLQKVMTPYLADGPSKPDGKDNQGELPSVQRPREGSSATESGPRLKEVSQPPSSARHEDTARPVDSRGTEETHSGSGEIETTLPATAPLQAKVPNNGPSKSDGPDEDPRTLQRSQSLSAASEASHYHTASNTPIIESGERELDKEAGNMSDGPGEAIDDSPSSSDREQAYKLYENQGSVAGNDPAAAWLGDPDRAKVREAYMQLFNWSNFNILAALRSLCDRLVLKGETQQVDRVLDAFSNRWCDCNPSHGFKATDVVHTICYSLLLLNTDLHLADIDQKMTKAQFVRNTMPTIHRVAMDAAPDGFETLRPSKSAKTISVNLDSLPTPSSTRTPSFPVEPGSASDLEKPEQVLRMLGPW
ncbi:hypothetical protein N7470_006769 [Penicillium chermesinum]|nr:hypothetical protein N7470_006769 [Penicillium chermesinum]